MSRSDHPSQKLDQFMLRLSNGLRDVIKVTAARNHRSMNSEILFHLEKAFSASNEDALVAEARAIWGDEAASQLEQKIKTEKGREPLTA